MPKGSGKPRSKSSADNEYRRRFREIAKYVDFDIPARPLKPQEKRKITVYWNEIRALKARPYHVYRPRNPENLAPAQQFAQHVKRLPGLKVAFIPHDGVSPISVRIRKSGAVSVRTRYVTSRTVHLTERGLLDGGGAYVREQIAIQAPGAKAFTIQAGRYEIPTAYTERSIANAIDALLANPKYSNSESNHYFGNWLFGLLAHSFMAQMDLVEYKKARQAAKRAARRKRNRR